MSPDGESIVTGAGDETLRFWSVFSKTRSQKVVPFLPIVSISWVLDRLDWLVLCCRRRDRCSTCSPVFDSGSPPPPTPHPFCCPLPLPHSNPDSLGFKTRPTKVYSAKKDTKKRRAGASRRREPPPLEGSCPYRFCVFNEEAVRSSFFCFFPTLHFSVHTRNPWRPSSASSTVFLCFFFFLCFFLFVCL